MRVFIRDRRTGLYYAPDGSWIASPEGALDLESVKAAQDLCSQTGLSGVEGMLISSIIPESFAQFPIYCQPPM